MFAWNFDGVISSFESAVRCGVVMSLLTNLRMKKWFVIDPERFGIFYCLFISWKFLAVNLLVISYIFDNCLLVRNKEVLINLFQKVERAMCYIL